MARPAPTRRRRRRAPWLVLAVLLLAAAGLVAAVVAWSGATLAGDPSALARVELQPLAGTLEQARASAPDGTPIPLVVTQGRLTPRTRLTPGEQVSVEVVIRRPGWLGWALGKERHERLTLSAPEVSVAARWLTVNPGEPLRVRFDGPVSAFAYGPPGRLRHTVDPSGPSVSLGKRSVAGTVEVAAAARSWERLGKPISVSWFPPSDSPVALVTPAPSTHISPAAPIRLTFSKTVDDALGAERPKLKPSVPGRWREIDSHTLVFTPSGLGFPLESDVELRLPKAVAVTDGHTAAAKTTSLVSWTVPAGSTLRLQQLLAQLGYLPVDWQPSGDPVARTPAAEVAAAVDPPDGTFSWRYPDTPPELRSLWSVGLYNQIVRGAVMMFQDTHGLMVDAFAGPQVWRALLADAVAGKRRDDGYSYVFVHRNIPQLLTLWHDGQVVLTSPGNTGVPAAPTTLGTFPVFEHISVGTMSGQNPDGSHYNDPGIKWISYFHGGEALHAFPRASFGTPQSLGCVELPLDAAAQVWPYTPIGTLVTIED